MVKVVCDTSFLIHLATARIKNLDRLGVEIGNIEFVVPQVVRAELEHLSKNPDKKSKAAAAQDLAQSLSTIPINGKFADSALVNYIRINHCMVGTMDAKLKKRIKTAGGSILSFSNDTILLEP